ILQSMEKTVTEVAVVEDVVISNCSPAKCVKCRLLFKRDIDDLLVNKLADSFIQLHEKLAGQSELLSITGPVSVYRTYQDMEAGTNSLNLCDVLNRLSLAASFCQSGDYCVGVNSQGNFTCVSKNMTTSSVNTMDIVTESTSINVYDVTPSSSYFSQGSSDVTLLQSTSSDESTINDILASSSYDSRSSLSQDASTINEIIPSSSYDSRSSLSQDTSTINEIIPSSSYDSRSSLSQDTSTINEIIPSSYDSRSSLSQDTSTINEIIPSSSYDSRSSLSQDTSTINEIIPSSSYDSRSSLSQDTSTINEIIPSSSYHSPSSSNQDISTVVDIQPSSSYDSGSSSLLTETYSYPETSSLTSTTPDSTKEDSLISSASSTTVSQSTTKTTLASTTTAPSALYPYGKSVGDSEIVTQRDYNFYYWYDAISDPINFSTGVPFGSDVVKVAHVREQYKLKKFNATIALVATWENVEPYSWYIWLCEYYEYYGQYDWWVTYYQDFYVRYCLNKTIETNTFQAVYATDGLTSYAIVTYKEGAMKWLYEQWTTIQVGFAHADSYKDYGVTYTDLTTKMDSLIWNTGLNCEAEYDACTEKPCLKDQLCTDKTAAEQGKSAIGYTCGPCPTGFEERGSFCVDVDECAEKTHNCQQLCENSEGGFQCSCLPGNTLTKDKKTCQQDATSAALCSAKGCNQVCSVVGGVASCSCYAGYTTTSDTQCADINECTLSNKPCSQSCENNVGGFLCSCYPGYKLDLDGVTCHKCDASYYGTNCSNRCVCNGHGTCNHVRGCECIPSWTGSSCTEDVNECSIDGACPIGQLCVNTLGSFSCSCPAGYENVTGQCKDINECANVLENNCDMSVEDCINNEGSYVCQCRSGFTRDANNICQDINECVTSTHNCEQICINTAGKFSCKCNVGFTLSVDRAACVQNADVCAGSGLKCSDICTVDLVTKTPYCLCKTGYSLQGTEKCVDVKECDYAYLNLCSEKDKCYNTVGGYSCSCSPGSRLDNDGRTCIACGQGKWGQECSNDCACSTGADRCDPQRGCICKPGLTGVHCDKDLDECSTGVVICGLGEECVNTIGSASCQCLDGYTKVDGNCRDFDECSSLQTNRCDQVCQNFLGGYTCLCHSGYRLEPVNKTCVDIDECSLNLDGCEQNCENTNGGYHCSCPNGLKLNVDGVTCEVSSKCSSKDCSDKCAVVNGIETCLCPKGKVLDSTKDSQCIDADMCQGNPCSETCNETPDGSGFTCSCGKGKKLAPDGFTCIDCTEGTFGDSCSQSCSCTTVNTASCDKISGACVCKSGWTGSTCDSDINECSSSSSCQTNTHCVNTPGSFICKCNDGYYLSSGHCLACRTGTYGEECKNQCTCDPTHSTCDKVTGHCTCTSGWTGAVCDTDVNECDNLNNDCLKANRSNWVCKNTPGSYTCTCGAGYEDKSNVCVDADECAASYSNECDGDCTNTAGSYTCSCPAGYRLASDGHKCDDVDECVQGTSGCQQKCTNEVGNFSCSCFAGYTVDETNWRKCYESSGYGFQVEIHIDKRGLNLREKQGKDYLDLKANLEQCLKASIIKKVPGLRLVSINNMRHGSVIVDFTTAVDTTVTSYAASKMVEAILSMAEKGIMVDGVLQNATVIVGSVKVPPVQDKCVILNALEPCGPDSTCGLNSDGEAYCSESSSSVNIPLVVGLCVGLPLALACILITVCCIKYKKKYSAQRQINVREGNYTDPPSTPKDGSRPSSANVDECAEKTHNCQQLCENSEGGFQCSCLPGNTLTKDKKTCQQECDASYYGTNCSNRCVCNGHGTCNHVRGCECIPGWTGSSCTEDVNECSIDGACPIGQLCVNTLGSFSCSCPAGYENVTGQCKDINECANVLENNCDMSVEDCINNEGSYICQCRSGFTRDANNVCQDINECVTSTHNCEQICANTAGKFSCKCNVGFTLSMDRAACVQNADVCAGSGLNCSDICTVDLVTKTPYCLCKTGYSLQGTEKCVDVKECDYAYLNLCSEKDKCYNTVGGYSCSCSPGSRLDNDGRTCIACGQGKWGQECSNNCACSTGADRCDPQRGCICKPGLTGVHCDKDLDECSTGVVICGLGEKCVNTIGSASCQCLDGYTKVDGKCRDIDECSSLQTNRCDQVCQNFLGGYTCLCHSGYRLEPVNKTCIDIDECSLNLDGCEQNCENTNGGYHCSCLNGLKLNVDGVTCEVSSKCSTKVCSDKCAVVNSMETCLCPKGKVLDPTKDSQCIDADMCQGNPCSETCKETPDGSGFTCSCGKGKKLAPDGITCVDCTEGTFGDSCSQSCSCTTVNTASCDKVSGACVCKSGWTGSTCDSDINECSSSPSCQTNTHCVNTPGSFICKCNDGYYLSSGQCLACRTGTYGEECKNQCTCDLTHSTCDKVTGHCACTSGWTGPVCDTDLNECDNLNNDCLKANRSNWVCKNTPGSYTCTCGAGYEDKNNVCVDSDECAASYSNECDGDCTNTAGSYTCSCPAGYRLASDGHKCDDVDECVQGTSGCQQKCTNEVGNFSCSCFTGYTVDETNWRKCYESSGYGFQVEIYIDKRGLNLREKQGKDYLDLKANLEQCLKASIIKKVPGLRLVSINNMRHGSVIVDFTTAVDTTVTSYAASKMVEAILSMAEKGIMVDGVLQNATVIVGSVKVPPVQDKCVILNALEPCGPDSTCGLNSDGEAYCSESSSSVNISLVVGLCVGLPLALACILITVCCIKYKKKYSAQRQINVREGNYTDPPSTPKDGSRPSSASSFKLAWSEKEQLVS
ncbi:hypothetical protein Btru_004630, partial [Bulinus truncatus]